MKPRYISPKWIGYGILIGIIFMLLHGCSSVVRPSSEVKTVLRAGCDLKTYHHNAQRQEIDIQCK